MTKSQHWNQTVGKNIARLRKEQRLSLRALCARVPTDRYGVMAHTTLRGIEQHGRPMTIDNLFALAEALEVSPLTLLLPAGDQADAVGHGNLTVQDYFGWLSGQAPLDPEADDFEREAFKRASLPRWAWESVR